MNRKLSFHAKTLDDQIVRDGLESTGLVKEPFYLVGGMATQSYLPTTCRRPTSDIDFSVVRPLNYDDFKSMIDYMRQFLMDQGYQTETKKHSSAYSLNVFDPQGDGLCIEFSRRNEKKFKEKEKSLQREFENTNNKIIEGKKGTYRVCRTEDIVIPKLVRSINSLRRNLHFNGFFSRGFDVLTDEGISEQLIQIDEKREEAIINLPNPDLAEELRFISDLYDIRLLSELVGFNKNYWDTVSGEWNTLNEFPKEKERLTNAILPKLD